MGFKIIEIMENSIADEAGIKAGDILINVNGKKIKDILEYKIEISDEMVFLLLEDRFGEIYEVEIEKEPNEDLGIVFEYSTLEREKVCRNKCIFCFIDQQPPSLRDSLYLKDDDYRLSFLSGNYISMTNLTDEELKRIVNLRLSPLYISVHTTNESLRKKMLNNPMASNILLQLKELENNGIKFHCQIVLCPGFNDGEELERTIGDLYALKNMISTAVVPVGLTKFRKNLVNINPVTKENAIAVMDIIEKWQKEFEKNRGTKAVFPSDELFLLGEKPIPSWEYYEGFPQLENGVGLIAKLKNELKHGIIPKEKIKEKICIVTGKLAYPVLQELLSPIINKYDLNVDIQMINNHFFGETITVAGLITGTDIINQFNNYGYDRLVIPSVMLKHDTSIFLDNISIEEVENSIKVPITKCDVNGQSLLNTIFGGK